MNSQLILICLGIMGKGMLGIFVVLGGIALLVALLGRLDPVRLLYAAGGSRTHRAGADTRNRFHG